MELTRAVGENIKRIRKSKKLSMERLAAEAGVSRSMLGQIERGEANPSVGIVGKLALALFSGPLYQRPLYPGALDSRLYLLRHRGFRHSEHDGPGADLSTH